MRDRFDGRWIGNTWSVCPGPEYIAPALKARLFAGEKLFPAMRFADVFDMHEIVKPNGGDITVVWGCGRQDVLESVVDYADLAERMIVPRFEVVHD